MSTAGSQSIVLVRVYIKGSFLENLYKDNQFFYGGKMRKCKVFRSKIDFKKKFTNGEVSTSAIFGIYMYK